MQHPTLLTLPYDIRHLIYQHLFPAANLIYIQARPNRSLAVLPTSSSASIPTALLTVNRNLHAESTAYLYTTYLFHIVGSKQDCLASYSLLERTLEKYASREKDGERCGNEVYVHVLSNGAHSSTGAILMHLGDGKLESVRRRGRGVEVGLQGLRREVGDGGRGGGGNGLDGHRGVVSWWIGVGGVAAVLIAMCAWVLSFWNTETR